jgi:protein-tyrosine kinase
MSKIEKALHRARGERKLQLVSRVDDPVRQLTPVPGNELPSPEQRVNATREIASMQEPQLRSKTALEQERIIYPEMDETGPVKAFREIRTKIVQRCAGRNCTIVVTSLNSNSGTSFVAFNLGVAFAFDAGKTALVMDCNLHHPSFHRFVMDSNHRGITDYLEDPQMDIGDIVYPVGIPRLRVIPAGENREVPAEYFTSARMQQLMQIVKTRYQERYVILDSPPMSQSADVQILMDMCDFVILVVPYGKITEAQLADAAKTIGDKKLLGVVFNGEPRPPGLIERRRKPKSRGSASLSRSAEA